jgi:hypothetical protein
MTISLTSNEADFLKQLAAAGEGGRTISGGRSRNGLARLVKARYVTDHSAGPDTVVFVITEFGRRALRDQQPGVEASEKGPLR